MYFFNDRIIEEMTEPTGQDSRPSTPFVFKGEGSNSSPFTVAITRFETEHMDRDGDLTLEVPYMDKNKQPLRKKFVVCSKTLSRASPVFKEMLYGGFAESKQPKKGDQSWTVKLPDDDHDSLKILLDIMHANFDKIPSKLRSLDKLYRIAVLTDKYDTAHLLRPWIHQWGWSDYINLAWNYSSEKSKESFLEKLLWISWQIGMQKQIQYSVGELADFSCIDDQGTLASKEDGGLIVLRFKDVLIPPCLYG